MMRYALAVTFFIIGLLAASQAMADDPSPATGEAIIEAGSLGVVMVTIGTSNTGVWSDFTSDDSGALLPVSMSLNGRPTSPGSIRCSDFGKNVVTEGDRIAILYFNPTESPIDVTVTATFDTFVTCPPM